MSPTTSLFVISLLAGAPRSAAITDEPAPTTTRDRRFRVAGHVLTGFDSNISQSAGEGSSGSVLQISADADYGRRLKDNFVIAGGLGIWSDLWNTDNVASRLGMETSFEMSSYVTGAGKLHGLGAAQPVYPRLMLRLAANYDFGFSLAQPVGPSGPNRPTGSASTQNAGVDDDLLDGFDGPVGGESVTGESDQLGRPGLPLREPYHRISAEMEARFEPWDATDIEIVNRGLRAMLDADPGDPLRHYSQFDVSLRLAQKVFGRLSVGGGYRFAFRDHEQRTNDTGSPLRYQTHYSEAFIRYHGKPWSARIRHLVRYRLINRGQSERVRQTLELRGSWKFYGPISAVTELLFSWEDRVNQTNGDWQRYAAVGGLRFRL